MTIIAVDLQSAAIELGDLIPFSKRSDYKFV